MGTSITNLSVANNSKVNWAAVAKKEGEQCLRGYIPAVPRNYLGDQPWSDKWQCINRSGVTVATGFDIGQRTEGELRGLPIEAQVIRKMLPFAAKAPRRPLIGEEAAQKLHSQKGLTISKPEADSIDLAVPRSILAKLVQLYEKARMLAGGPVPFLLLPGSIQTAIFSFAYQYGPGWRTDPGKGPDSKKFWDCIVAQRWIDAVNVLRSYRHEHVARRHEEARWIEAGKTLLPTGPGSASLSRSTAKP